MLFVQKEGPGFVIQFTIKTVATIVAIFAFLIGTSHIAGESKSVVAYYSLLSHLTVEDFSELANGGERAVCKKEKSGYAFDYIAKYKSSEREAHFREESIIWGIKEGEKWLVFLNGFLQVSFVNGQTYELTEEEFNELVSTILDDFSDTHCSFRD